MSYRTVSSESSEDISTPSENASCIFLHIAEGVGLQRSRCTSDYHDQITMHASLNNVKFEIEGHSTESATIFNSNCVWECSLNDLKRMRTENRPVRIVCFLNNGTRSSPPLKQIGTLLLPIRGLPTVNTISNYQPKMLWHKLGALSTEWRPYKPEICLLIVVAKKALVNDNSLTELLSKKSKLLRSPRTTETASMLHSQSNVYVQLLEQLGLIQVGNNPDVDCDIFVVVLALKRVKDLAKLLETESSSSTPSKFVFQYELFGSATLDEITTDVSDSYVLNQKVSLKFKASAQSLQLYFQRIFYIPIVMYFNGHAVATYRFDCSKFFPELHYFNSNRVWNKNGSFCFDRLHKLLSPRAPKPSVDFSFSVQLLEVYSKKFSKEIVPLKSTFVPYKLDEGAAGDGKSGYQTARSSNSKCSLMSSQKYNRAKSEPMMTYTTAGKIPEHLADLTIEMRNASTDTVDLRMRTNVECKDACMTTDETAEPKTIGVNTESVAARAPPDAETLTLNMVKELEAWKTQQMDEFLEKLERKEVIYLRNLEKDWKKQRKALEQSLEDKKAECEQMRRELEELKTEFEAQKRADTLAAKQEAERNHAEKVQTLAELENQKRTRAMEKLELEAQQQEATKLQHKNHILKKNLAELEQKLTTLGKTHFSAGQLKEMMTDLRQQTERFADVEKQRNFFKDKLSKANRELQQLKLSMLKQQELSLLQSSKDNPDDLDFGNVPQEGEVPLNCAFKPKHVIESKIETKTIKEMILLDTESTTSYDDNDESGSTEF